MTSRRLLIVQGHPDPAGGHFGHALADAYRDGAIEAGHEVRAIGVAALRLPLLSGKDQWEHGGDVPAEVRTAQELVTWAQHVVILYPLWLGGMPAVLKGFFEQLLRPAFAFPSGAGVKGPRPLAGKSVRIIVTMGMPAFFYRWYFGAHSLKSLERNILGFCGFRPVRHTLIGLVEGKAGARDAWLKRVRDFGRRAV